MCLLTRDRVERMEMMQRRKGMNTRKISWKWKRTRRREGLASGMRG